MTPRRLGRNDLGAEPEYALAQMVKACAPPSHPSNHRRVGKNTGKLAEVGDLGKK